MNNKKHKIIFCGDLTQNNGPANVNKSLYKHLHNNHSFTFIDTKSPQKFKMICNYLIKLLTSKLIIFSCNYKTNYYFFKIAKIFRKKTIFLMHSYSNFDALINKIDNCEKVIKREQYVLDKVDLILTVSSVYKDLLEKSVPALSNKLHYITSGIEKDDYKEAEKNSEIKRIENKIAVCGGNRFIKCNKNVCIAVERLNDNGYKCSLDVYGLMYDNNEMLDESQNVKIVGRVPRETLYEELRKTQLFVLNGKIESFGLSVVDALMCGCNIMISEKAGITSILELEENDIIHDYNDIDELCKKIKYNLENSNNERIKKSIDFERYSWENVSERLEQISKGVIENSDIKDII